MESANRWSGFKLDLIGKQDRAAAVPSNLSASHVVVVVHTRRPANKDGRPGMESVFKTGASHCAIACYAYIMPCSVSLGTSGIAKGDLAVWAAPVTSGCCWGISFSADLVSSTASSIISLGFSVSVLAKAGAYRDE